MMLVKVLQFGSNWWARFGRDETDPWRFTRRAAFYNSAGLCCGSKIRRHWVTPGVVRFNGNADFNPHFPVRSIGKIFHCDLLRSRSDGNRVLLSKRASIGETPDCFLVALSSDRHGLIDLKDPSFKSKTALPIAISELRERQELLILMRAGDWVRTCLGHWQLATGHEIPNGGSLELVEAGGILGN